ncbi:MAG: lipid-A-disaccharide synthase [Gammaproteobacteria bacterium]|nr:lipid-A-disaccharide synthase [Gammaproteobacteria bacterium]
MRIGIVAGELSGDILGAGLIRALRLHCPDAVIEGIGGPQMLAAGFHSHYPLELLSVMGLTEVLSRYLRLKRCHKGLGDYFIKQPPHVFIGIDAPDFNLGLERRLKAAGIPTVHYVSPSVWAWRQYRLPKIARSCDLMLTLFPFEAAFYEQHHIPVCFTGHPLAEQIPLSSDKIQARNALGLTPEGKWVALLPGSRINEVSRLSEPFLQTAKWLLARRPELRFVAPLANQKTKKHFEQTLAKFELPLSLIDGQSRTVMAAADVLLMASGTATLEAMLLKRPMLVAYRLAPLTYWLAKHLVKTPYFSLPNLLARQALVPEFLQHEVVPERLGPALLAWLDEPEKMHPLQKTFTEIHHTLKRNADTQAAQAILALIQ